MQEAFNEVDSMAKNIDSSRCKIAIIPTTDLLLRAVEKYADTTNKPYEIIKKRGDIQKLRDAQRGGKFLISGMDYVGGLEFDAVVIVGVDKGRLPPIEENGMTESKHYLTYSSYNRLYVAITRAKYAVGLIYSAPRGISVLLDSSIKNEVVNISS
jgi:superfamily I DNA/RNA helicase